MRIPRIVPSGLLAGLVVFCASACSGGSVSTPASPTANLSAEASAIRVVTDDDDVAVEPLPAPSGLATKEPFAAEDMEEVHMEFDVLAASSQNSLLFPWINNDGRTIMVGYSNEKGEALALEVNARLGEPDFVTIYEVPYSWYELSEVADLLGDGTFVESWVDPENDVAVLRVTEDTPEVRERIVKAGFADRAVLLVDPDWVEPVLG